MVKATPVPPLQVPALARLTVMETVTAVATVTAMTVVTATAMVAVTAVAMAVAMAVVTAVVTETRNYKAKSATALPFLCVFIVAAVVGNEDTAVDRGRNRITLFVLRSLMGEGGTL